MSTVSIQSTFIDQLVPALHNYNRLKQQPKSEIHLHLGGSYPQSYLTKIATAQQAQQLQDLIAQIRNRDMSYESIFAQFFPLIEKIVITNRQVEDGVVALCDELAKDHVTYVEIRTGLKQLGGSTWEDYLNAVMKGMHRGAQNNPNLKVSLILSLRRNSSQEEAKEAVDLALEHGVVGLDISGDITKGNIQNIMPELLRAKQEHLPITLHIGENKKELTQTIEVGGNRISQQLFELQTLNPKRVGHAVHLTQEAKNWIVEKKIPIECCPSSSVMAGMISSYHEHPAYELYHNGHPCIFCSDDTLPFITTLSQELTIAAQCLNQDPQELAEHQRQLVEEHRFK